jgi:predicted tellurium resistance membrane protein TerC
LLDLASLLTFDTAASFVALTFLEIILGVDNIVFVAVAAGRLAPHQRAKGRQLGLWLAMGLRVAMLVGIVWVARMEATLFMLPNGPFSIKDAVLTAGGLFLIYKGSTEIHDDLEGHGAEAAEHRIDHDKPAKFWPVVLEIGVINIVFSLDSVITAVGMANQIEVMVAAVVVATGLMMVAADPVAKFISRRPSAKMLALAFVILVGVALIAEGTGFHMPRGYLYFAMGFSLFVEVLNGLRNRKKHPRKPEN